MGSILTFVRCRRPPLPALLALGLLAAALGGCGRLGYYAQSVGGHLDLMGRSRPIPDLLAPGAETPPELRRRLALVRDIRDFASAGLGLPDNPSYRSFAALERPFAVWSVVAAPPLALEPRTWCFPFAGCVAYRGYFDRDAARRFAHRLERRGDDVYLAGVPAYSTLGWLDDPLPSTVVHWPPRHLAGLLFHELAHQVVYVDDDSGFNEAFATTVERVGVRRWLRAAGREAELATLAAEEAREALLLDLLARTRERLAAVYGGEASRAERLRRKAAVLEGLRGRCRALAREHGPGPWDAWAEGPVNNARLALVATYHHLVPAFDALLRETGGDLGAFYARVEALAGLPRGERRERLATAAHRGGASAAIAAQAGTPTRRVDAGKRTGVTDRSRGSGS